MPFLEPQKGMQTVLRPEGGGGGGKVWKNEVGY